jgi:hypothetical protein
MAIVHKVSHRHKKGRVQAGHGLLQFIAIDQHVGRTQVNPHGLILVTR